MHQKFKFKKADLGIFNTIESDLIFDNFEKGFRVIGLTRGLFSLIDLIHSALKKTGSAHVVTATWSAGIKDVHNVKWMMDTNLIRSFILITDYSFALRKEKYELPIQELFGKENIRTSDIHAKFVLIHNEDYNLVITTSMNLNANKTCENFEINEDEDIFNFYMQFVSHTVGDMPAGFASSSIMANKSLDKFFNKTDDKKEKKWWNIE